jgi:hypothetical protein
LKNRLTKSPKNSQKQKAHMGVPSIAWSKNEEMVDWLAIQFPKMYAAFKSVNAT